ncbi:hypothetical protein BRD01_06075 [Halobacteriales archaeon QS_8_65_32]|nr:MAG: hypothetical protein BRD01_06075 [Halobacteriales archaeon QS_8_65_32]
MLVGRRRSGLPSRCGFIRNECRLRFHNRHDGHDALGGERTAVGSSYRSPDGNRAAATVHAPMSMATAASVLPHRG